VAGWRIVLETTATDPVPTWGRTLVPGRLEMVEGPGVLLLDGVAP
jgi:hypothetical protein